jgi:hypothetical protein
MCSHEMAVEGLKCLEQASHGREERRISILVGPTRQDYRADALETDRIEEIGGKGAGGVHAA